MKNVEICVEAVRKTKACAMVIHDPDIREGLIMKAERLRSGLVH